MRRVLELALLLVLTTMLVQCTEKTKRMNIVSMQAHKATHAHYDSIISMEKLKEMGIDKGTLLKHIALQENAWNGGDFRDDQSTPQYMPTETDFQLTIPLVEYYLTTHSYNQPSSKLFQERIKYVFGTRLKMDKTKGYEGIGSDGDFSFALPYYAIYKDRFITYNWLLRDLLSIEGDKIKLKSQVFQQIKALNDFIFYNDMKAFKLLENLQAQGDDDGLGTPYNGVDILDDLFSTYRYYQSPKLNQWYFLRHVDEPFDFVNRIFDKAPNNNIIAHTLLIETIENNTTGKKHDYYDDHFANYIYDLMRDENDMNSKHFTLQQKAQIFCYFANSEHKMREKYRQYITSNLWDPMPWTCLIMLRCKEVYQYARTHKYFGISSPKIMEEMEQEGFSDESDGPDPE